MPVVFIDVDTQFDFMDPQGKLYVPGADELEDNIRELIREARNRQLLVISTADNHPEDDPEFEQFPPHCVMDTPGQLKMPWTVLSHPVHVPWDVPVDVDDLPLGGQLVFEKRKFSVFDNPDFAPYVERVVNEFGGADDPVEFVIFGVATDYCVRGAALGFTGTETPEDAALELAEEGYNVHLVTDAIAAVDDADGEEALQEMREAGVDFITTDEALELIEERSGTAAVGGSNVGCRDHGKEGREDSPVKEAAGG